MEFSPEFEIKRDELVAYKEDFQIIGLVLGIQDEELEILTKLPGSYYHFISLFSSPLAKSLPSHTQFDHAIDLEPGKTTSWGPIYSLSQKELKILREYLDKMVAEEKIQVSKSPAGSPILFVPKPNKGLRVGVDYHGLNKVTVKYHYPLPLMSESRDRVTAVTVFTKLDLKDGDYLVWVKEDDE